MLRRSLSLLVLSTALLSQQLYAVDGQDHPLFSAYPNAKLQQAKMLDYENLTLPVSQVDTAKQPALTALKLVGDLYQHQYKIENVSTLKVYENYLAAAKKVGFKPLFTCALDACGSQLSAPEIGKLIKIDGNLYGYENNPYYWVGEKSSPKGKITVAWFIGANDDGVEVQQVIVEEEPLETGLVKVDSTYENKAGTPTPLKSLSQEDKARDNPILPRYPGARIEDDKKIDSETIKIPFAINAAEKTPLQLTGNLTKHSYVIAGISTLKVYENYKAALTKASFAFLSQCELEQCGNEKQVNDVGGQISPSGSLYGKYRKPFYLLAKKALPTGNIYVALFVGSDDFYVGVQQVILQERQMQTGLISVSADSLKQQIDADGKALIYGIYFDTGKAAIKAESKPTLDAIANLLKRNPDLLLYVVGHTDDTGDGAANVALSKQRADSVIAMLLKEYQIAANRLQAQGIGPYAPASNNASEAGKQKNRRVELVKRLR